MYTTIISTNHLGRIYVKPCHAGSYRAGVPYAVEDVSPWYAILMGVAYLTAYLQKLLVSSHVML